MISPGKANRLRRILKAGHGSLVVAFDHPLGLGPIPGTINPSRQIARFIEGGADALLLNLGMMGHVAEAAPKENLPGLIARLDWTTALGTASQIPAGPYRKLPGGASRGRPSPRRRRRDCVFGRGQRRSRF